MSKTEIEAKQKESNSRKRDNSNKYVSPDQQF